MMAAILGYPASVDASNREVGNVAVAVVVVVVVALGCYSSPGSKPASIPILQSPINKTHIIK